MQLQNMKWHAISAGETLESLHCTQDGLSSEEAKKRQVQFGLNQMGSQKKMTLLKRFLYQFHNVLIYVLIAAAVVAAILGHWIDCWVIVGVVLINAIIGVIQEGKAEKALDAIRHMLSSQAMVRRDGRFELIPAEDIVPGDIVTLQSGDKVPADLRLIQIKELRLDESLLTGESLPVLKDTASIDENTVIAERQCIAHSGTLVTFGTAIGVVVATGEESQIGRINVMLRDVEKLTTPLLKQVGQFGRWLTAVIVILAAATFIFGTLVHGFSTIEMFMAAVGLSVAAIPEGLPAIMTITLAIGVQRMAQRHAIIRRLPAVETLGSVTVICSDKTGTLTRNEMMVQSVSTSTSHFNISGNGYDPHGMFFLENEEVNMDENPVLSELARASLLCNDATVDFKEDKWLLQGDPTEGALVVLSMKSGLDASFERKHWLRSDVIPFESENGYMATLHHDNRGNGVIYIKGSPEKILELCSCEQNSTEQVQLRKEYWLSQIDLMAKRGERVLAIASRKVDDVHRSLHFEDLKGTLTLLGVVGMIDPPRTEAIKAVSICHQAGIKVKMITGDHVKTAMAIGEAMGIGVGKRNITGVELDKLDDETFNQKVEKIDVFARTSPEQKLRIVRALQANGHIIAMTGDGVNDAPALKRADVGIAMGINGTEVSKEAAEIVLADDNFASIVHAVEEGRTVYDNLKKSIVFILPTSGGEALTIIAAILLGMMLPITPVQILWINMITTVTLALVLAFEPPEGDVMKRHPRSPDAPFLTADLLVRILYVSLILMAGTFGLFVWSRETGSSIEEARTIAVNTLVFFEIFYLFNTRYFIRSALTPEIFHGNKYVLYAVALLIVFQLLFTYAAPMQALFHTSDLGFDHWASIVLVSSSVFFLVELEKWMIRKWKK